jgi:dienelactone hydrolase
MAIRPTLTRFLATGFLLSGPAHLVAQQATPALVGEVSFDAPSAQLHRIAVTVGDGGTGSYPAVLAGDTSLPTHTLYRPRDLSPFGASNRLPIVAWANGACRNNSGEYRNFLSEIASHGFLVVAIGPAAHSLVLGSGAPGGGTEASQLLDGVAWAIAQNAVVEGEYHDRIAVDRVALMGHSCGGAQALDVSRDPRVTTTVLWNSGLFREPRSAPPAASPAPAGAAPPRAPSSMVTMTKERLRELHGPVAYFVGGTSDVAYENAVDDFERIDHVPVLFASQDVGHYPATFRNPHGGAYGTAAVAWLKWHLKGDQQAAAAFRGSDCGLCADPAWTVRSKALP